MRRPRTPQALGSMTWHGSEERATQMLNAAPGNAVGPGPASLHFLGTGQMPKPSGAIGQNFLINTLRTQTTRRRVNIDE